jgi:hypothetical protein
MFRFSLQPENILLKTRQVHWDLSTSATALPPLHQDLATSAPALSHIFPRPMPHLHRDLRQDDTEIALSDFGLAKLFDEDHAKVTGSTRVSPWALQYATVWT